MRKITNWIVGLMAAAVVVAITYITLDSSLSNIIYNSCFLAAMIVILIVGCGIGFGRMRQTQHGLDQATEKLKAISDGGGNMSAITKPGAAIFGVPYFDAKYQEYLHYLRKTNSPTDIGDYIGEYEINNYTHRRLLEMIPDILTSLGILGTFVGLVLGLRHFNPTSYEAMSGSVESLIDGIKVAFVTSIYGISLSLAFSYWLRGALTGVSESLDRFLDAYYTTAVTPTDRAGVSDAREQHPTDGRASGQYDGQFLGDCHASAGAASGEYFPANRPYHEAGVFLRVYGNAQGPRSWARRTRCSAITQNSWRSPRSSTSRSSTRDSSTWLT